ncbi:MAG: sugar phosphate isomerase/epimerase [Actinomycetia bacterium]|nr:sugar phosphate isomerase/epimerase [Actinomycetes bacterium]
MEMRENIEFGTTIALWSQCPDRFLSQGYKKAICFEEKIKTLSKIKDIKGVDLYGDWDVNLQNVGDVKNILSKYNLKTFIVTADVNSLPEFGRGSITSPFKESRKLGWQKIVEAIDIANLLNCKMINLWFGQDGYDYAFQTNYLWAWDNIINTVKNAADYAAEKNIKIALEYKPREPRTHIFTASAVKMLIVSEKVGRDNVGVLIDSGHGYMAGENISEAAALCKLFGEKLYYVHVNDNYKVWDDDMMVGSIHLFEIIEFLYWLEKLSYKGPIVLDMFTYREDPLGAASESIEYIKRIYDLIKEIDENEINNILEKQDAVASMKFLRKYFLK